MYNLYKGINIVDDYKIKRTEWLRLIIRMKDEKKSQERLLMRSFIIQDQWENQEQDGRTSSGGTCHVLGVRGWTRRAEDREEIRRLPREDSTQKMDGWVNGWYSVLCGYMARYQITPS